MPSPTASRPIIQYFQAIIRGIQTAIHGFQTTPYGIQTMTQQPSVRHRPTDNAVRHMLTNDMQPTNTECRLRHKAYDTAFKKYFIMVKSTHITTTRADKLRDLCLMARAISATIAALAIILSCSSHKSDGHISASKYPEVAKAMMQTARQQAAAGNTAKSIATYESCAMLSAADESADDSLVAIISDATVQIVNAYQTIGKPEECVRRLQAMLAKPHTTLHRKCRRDAMVCLAYAMSRTEAMTEAANAMVCPRPLPRHQRPAEDKAVCPGHQHQGPPHKLQDHAAQHILHRDKARQ